MPHLVCRRQATAAQDSRSELQSPHAPSPTSTAKQSQFSEDMGTQPSARSSLDSPAEPASNTPSSASGTPTTLGKAADQQRQQPAQVWKQQLLDHPISNFCTCTGALSCLQYLAG